LGKSIRKFRCTFNFAPPVSRDLLTAYVRTIDVPNLDEYLAEGEKLKASICVPKMAIPGVGWLAYMKDTEGNIFGMIQPDENPK